MFTPEKYTSKILQILYMVILNRNVCFLFSTFNNSRGMHQHYKINLMYIPVNSVTIKPLPSFSLFRINPLYVPMVSDAGGKVKFLNQSVRLTIRTSLV